METNSRLRALLQDPAFADERPVLPESAQALVDDGWTVGPNGTLLLRNRWAGRAIPLPPDEIGSYEYDTNDVYIPLDHLRGSADFLAKAAALTIHVAKQLLRSGLDLPGSQTLTVRAAVFVDTGDELFDLQGGRLRLFTRRSGSPEWVDDLERFDSEAVALLDASDIDDPEKASLEG